MKRLAIATFAVGAVLVAFFVVMIVRSAPSSPQPIDGGLVHISKEGLTLWASESDVQATCQVKTAADEDVPLEVPSGSESISINEVDWYLVARSVEKVPPGDYLVSCVDDSGTTLAVGPRFSILPFALSILGAIFSAAILVVLGPILLAVGARRRRKSGSGNTFPGNPPSGPQPGYPQPGYPQPGYPQPGGPQPGGPQPGGPQPGGPQYGPGQPGNTFPGYPPPGTYKPGPNPDRPQDRPQDS